ncbi:hypothetical protein C8R45DRAFT_961737 [Mycena sanguinolenta]|nr:hypothetical protein C8R45DRAFT_961737 [Mycena sanguinolenta]
MFDLEANARALAQELARPANPKPANPGGPEAHRSEEIPARSDLVESSFGSLVDIDGAAQLLHEFLSMSILSVQREIDGELKDVANNDHKAACADAAIQAREAMTPSERAPDPYRWKWNLPVEESATSTALFLNVVSIAAHAAATRSGQTQGPPSLRFIILPNPEQPIPLSKGAVLQDCCPDVVALEGSAFCGAPNVHTPANRFLLLQDSPFDYIRKNFPAILDFTTAHRSAHGPAITAFEEWFEAQEKRNYLDMSRFCWPEVQLTVKANWPNLCDAILQESEHMREQRRTQPWMRSIVGVVMTKECISVLRADPLGFVQCTFDRTCSHGVLDSIRICLGLVRSNCLQRGQHEAFELADAKTLAPPHLKLDPDVSTTQDPLMQYTHRTVRFIRLRGSCIHYSQDGTNPDLTTYYVHHLIQDRGTLVGRCPRIFCVSRETASAGFERHFVGPYALKLFYPEHASGYYRDDLVSVARNAQVKNVLLPTWEWWHGDVLSMRGTPPYPVKKSTDPQAASIVSNREEIFAQSDLKRLLVQSSGYDEFAQAFIDFAEAIASLTEHDIAHRDVSIGNLLLRQDIPCAPSFLTDAAASASALLGVPAVFTQRALEQRIGGLLHDMDMAGRAHEFSGFSCSRRGSSSGKPLQQPPPQPPQPEEMLRMGTFAFMAPGLLMSGPPHFVAYDLHSLLFVMTLFFWSYPGFLSISDAPFPHPVSAKSRSWPEEISSWATRRAHHTLPLLGTLKQLFFSKPLGLQETLHHGLSGDLWTTDPAYLDLFWTLYDVLWKKSLDYSSAWTDRYDVTPREVGTALEAAFAAARKKQYRFCR